MLGKLKITSFASGLWLTLCVFVVFAITFVIYVHSEKQIDRANELRLQSFLLADELRQSSDDLTRMVRSYVVTGTPLYKQHYLEILDIRNGKMPRPAEYQSIYWDLVLADDKRPTQDSGRAIPLLELMRESGFTEAEFAKLAQAKDNSDALTNTEFAAMKLVESTIPIDGAGRNQALRLLHDENYHQAKANIMVPIRMFYQLMDQRTLANVKAAENAAILVRRVFVLFGVLLICMLWLSYRALKATLGSSVEELQERIARLGGGDIFSIVPVSRGMENSVSGWLSQTQIKLARVENQRRAAEDEIQTLAYYDPLTNLPNRRLLNDRLSLVMAASKRTGCYAALMFLDLDNFKPLNDMHGHVAGDLLLIEAAKRLKSCVREVDTVARFGGDEFVVILNEMSTDKVESTTQANIVSEKIRTILSEPYILRIPHGANAEKTVGHLCTVSIGVVVFINQNTSTDDILKWADTAMYHAKQSGRNSIHFYESST